MYETTTLYQKFLRSYKKDEVVFNEGEQANEMFLIHSGSVRIMKKGKQGEVKTIDVLDPGDFFGEMALIDRSPRSASAVAQDDGTELLILDHPKFSYMLQQLPEFSLAIMRKLTQRMRERDRKWTE